MILYSPAELTYSTYDRWRKEGENSMVKLKWTQYCLFPITFLLCMAVLCSVFAGFRNAAGSSTLSIVNIKGDRSVLDDIVIRGVLQDRYHGLEFEIRNEKSNRRFQFYESEMEWLEPELRSPNQLQEGNIYRGEKIYEYYNTEYVIPPEAKAEITYQKSSDENGSEIVKKITASDRADVYVMMNKSRFTSNNRDQIRFHTDVWMQNDSKPYKKTENQYYNESGDLVSTSGDKVQVPESFRMSGDNSHAFVRLGGSIYFTVLSTPNHSGTGGIYEAEEFGKLWIFLGGGEQTQTGKVRTVTTFPLDNPDKTVLGLNAVNGKLILSTLENGMLVLRAYDPESGKLLDELEAASYDPSDYSGDFQCFVEGSKMHLNIPRLRERETGDDSSRMATQESSREPAQEPDQQSTQELTQGPAQEPAPELTYLLVSVAFDNDAFSLLHRIEGLNLEKGELITSYPNGMVDSMDEAGGKLFVFAYITREEDRQNLPDDSQKPQHYLLFVFQDGKLLYQGEVMNDSDEDYIAERQGYSIYRDLGSDFQYRRFHAVNVREEDGT